MDLVSLRRKTICVLIRTLAYTPHDPSSSGSPFRRSSTPCIDATSSSDRGGDAHCGACRSAYSRIRSGSWAPGYRLPSEADLCDHFGTARMTVSRALRSLTEDGLVIRKRRAGSFVAQPDAPAATGSWAPRSLKLAR